MAEEEGSFVTEFYNRLAATAVRMINKRGRLIRLIRFDETAANAGRPWKGPPINPTEPGSDVFGVFVPPTSVRQFGLSALGLGTEMESMIATSEQIIIVSAGETDLRQFSEVLDQSERWGIFTSQILKPGSTTLLGFLGVRR